MKLYKDVINRLRIALLLLAALSLLLPGTANAALVLTGFSSDPVIQNTAVVSEGRIGDLLGSATYELDIGATTSAPSQTAEFVWTPRTAQPFTLTYNNITNLVSFTVGGNTLTYTPVTPVTASSDIYLIVHAASSLSITISSIVLDNCVLNGTPVLAQPFASTITGTGTYVLEISGVDLSSGFTLTGESTINWADSPSTQYRVAYQISVADGRADMSINKSASPEPVLAGQNLTYTINVTNNGPGTATGVTVTDALPSGVNYVSAAGTDWTCSENAGIVTCSLSSSLTNGSTSANISIVVTPTAAGTISNTASVSSNLIDPNMANNTTLPVYSTVNPSADLLITKSDSPDPVTVGSTLTYSITVTNNGPSTATGVIMTDSLPAGVSFDSASSTQGSCTEAGGTVTCPLGSLANGATATIIIAVRPAITGTITNTASVISNEDQDLTNNTTPPVTTTVNPASVSNADLIITKTDLPDPVPVVGDNVTYTITVTNNGPGTANGVTMTDVLDSGTTLFGSVTSSQGTCSGTTTINCSIGTLASGYSATITIVAKTNPPAGMISNTASVSATEFDPNTANNSATATTNVGDISRLVGISTRGKVETGTYVMVGGFSFGGILSKQVLVRGRGPSMSGPPYNFTGTLTNPILELYSGPTLFAVVDNWQNGATQCDAPAISCGTPAAMQAISVDPCQPNVGQTTAPPGCTQEAAFLITLPPGAYTAKLKGVNGEMGKGIIEVYDPDTSTMPKVEGISTRGKVLTGTDIMVGGFVIGAGNSSKKVLIRGRGPSMSGAPYNFTGTLSNPTLEVYSGQTLFATIDDWGTGATTCNAPAILCGTPAELQTALVDPCQPNAGQTTAPPGCNLESALFITLPPGAYTAKLKGVNNGTGIGIVEIYDMP